MRLDDSNKILLVYIFSYIQAVIYKLSLNNDNVNNHYVASISERRKYFTLSNFDLVVTCNL